MLVSAILHIVKKAFLSEQSKEIEKNNRMGKTRDRFKKIGKKKKENLRYQGNISCKDEYEDRNGKDLKEAEKIKKNQQEYMEELYKKKV